MLALYVLSLSVSPLPPHLSLSPQISLALYCLDAFSFRSSTLSLAFVYTHTLALSYILHFLRLGNPFLGRFCGRHHRRSTGSPGCPCSIHAMQCTHIVLFRISSSFAVCCTQFYNATANTANTKQTSHEDNHTNNCYTKDGHLWELKKIWNKIKINKAKKINLLAGFCVVCVCGYRLFNSFGSGFCFWLLFNFYINLEVVDNNGRAIVWLLLACAHLYVCAAAPAAAAGETDDSFYTFCTRIQVAFICREQRILAHMRTAHIHTHTHTYVRCWFRSF